jgi:hypothetical protein
MEKVSLDAVRGLLGDTPLLTDVGSAVFNSAIENAHFFGYTQDMTFIGPEANGIDSLRVTINGKRLVVVWSAADLFQYTDKFFQTDISTVFDKCAAMLSKTDVTQFAELTSESSGGGGLFFGHVLPQTVLWIPAGYIVAEKAV